MGRSDYYFLTMRSLAII